MKVYVASSWRNEYFPEVVRVLRDQGHEVYDFTDSEGFSWKEVDPQWQQWKDDVNQYFNGLQHPLAQRGFARDMEALESCDAVVYVTPCGVSASLEAGWAKGVGKFVVAYMPAIREPDLMVLMFHAVTNDLLRVVDLLGVHQEIYKLTLPAAIYRTPA